MRSFGDVVMAALEWGWSGAIIAAGICAAAILFRWFFALMGEGFHGIKSDLNWSGFIAGLKVLGVAVSILGGYFFSLGFFIKGGAYLDHPWIGLLLAITFPFALLYFLWGKET